MCWLTHTLLLEHHLPWWSYNFLMFNSLKFKWKKSENCMPYTSCELSQTSSSTVFWIPNHMNQNQETLNKILKHTQFFHVWNSQETCYFLSFTFRELIVSSWFLLWCSKSIQFFVQTPYCYSIIWCLNFFVCNKYWKIHDTVFAKFLFPILRTKKE